MGNGEEAAEILAAIASLDGQLREVGREAAARHRQIDDREIEMVARQSDVEDARNDAYRKLDEILSRIVPSYENADSVTTLATYVESIRPERDRATNRIR
jgi:hypothetical protein